MNKCISEVLPTVTNHWFSLWQKGVNQKKCVHQRKKSRAVGIC